MERLETTLGSVVDLVQATRERAVEAKGILTDNQRGFIATDMKVKLEALLSLANSSDGSGQFLSPGIRGQRDRLLLMVPLRQSRRQHKHP